MTTNSRKKIGEIIQKKRIEKNITIEEMAILVNSKDYKKIETGIKYPGSELLKKIDDILELELERKKPCPICLRKFILEFRRTCAECTTKCVRCKKFVKEIKKDKYGICLCKECKITTYEDKINEIIKNLDLYLEDLAKIIGLNATTLAFYSKKKKRSGTKIALIDDLWEISFFSIDAAERKWIDNQVGQKRFCLILYYLLSLKYGGYFNAEFFEKPCFIKE